MDQFAFGVLLGAIIGIVTGSFIVAIVISGGHADKCKECLLSNLAFGEMRGWLEVARSRDDLRSVTEDILHALDVLVCAMEKVKKYEVEK